MEKSGKPKKHVLRPLFWWLILVLVLYGIRTHQRLMETTRLEFTVTMQGQPHFEATTTFDGKPIVSGQKIPLGNHTFAVTLPKGEPFSTNLFIWYGDHNFGTIDLKRTMGTLSVTADPPAPFIFIRGPEWSVTLTNSSGLTQSVPTDQYTVESRYGHWGHADDVTVFSGTTAAWFIAPRLGAVQLSCNQSDANFQLLTLDDRQEEAGGFPTLITELPEGNYKLISQHHGHQQNQTLAVKAGTTNDSPVEFLYGAAMLETEPPEATVQDGNGRDWGITPLNLPELVPGTLQFTLHRSGYEPVAVSLEISANQTNIYQTNLVSTGYTGGMKAARQFMAVSDYDKALEEVDNALLAKPDDADAIILRHEAAGRDYIQRAKALGKLGDYIEGGKELTLALQSLPDNEEAKLLVADFKQHEPEEIERIRIEHLNSGTNTFNAFVQGQSDEELFDSHILKTTMPVKDVEAAILDALRIQPAFQVTTDNSPTPDTFEIGAVQELSTYLATSAGRRQCFIVGAQTRPDETQIIYKVLEYKTEAQIKFSIGNLIGAPGAVNYIPVSPARIPKMTDKLIAQIQYGVSNLTVRIQGAIGQTPAPAVQPAVTQ
jgi:tetratricopeptide (TPR) repeat protein